MINYFWDDFLYKVIGLYGKTPKFGDNGNEVLAAVDLMNKGFCLFETNLKIMHINFHYIRLVMPDETDLKVNIDTATVKKLFTYGMVGEGSNSRVLYFPFTKKLISFLKGQNVSFDFDEPSQFLTITGGVRKFKVKLKAETFSGEFHRERYQEFLKRNKDLEICHL